MERVMRRGFTVIELAAALAAGAALAASAGVALQPARDGNKQLKDASQVRSFAQAAIVFAGNNADRFPLPSALDGANATVRETGRAKDTTANIFSIMIFNGSIAPELCVSPAEASPSIKVDADYKYADPPTAVTPAAALWDPAFAADFTGGKTGNVSYAHLQTSDGRMGKWSNTFDTFDVLFANRGPKIAEVMAGPTGPATVRTASKDSVTYRILGGPGSWEGNVAHGDGHVTFYKSFLPNAKEAKEWPFYYNAKGTKTPDVIFFDETDDAGRPEKDGQPAIPPRSNAYLGIFTKAGAKPEDFTAIWD